MKTRVALLALALAFTTLSARAADPVIDALVSQIQSNPSGAPAATAQAAAANPAIASDIFNAAFEAAPDQITEIVKATVATSPDVALTAFEAALKSLTAGLDKKLAEEKAQALYSAALASLPSDGGSKKLAGSLAGSLKNFLRGFKGANHKPDFPHQRPPVVVSPSR